MEKIYAVKTKYVKKAAWKDEVYVENGETKTRKVRVEKQVLKHNFSGAHRKTVTAMIRAGEIRKCGTPFVGQDGWTVQQYA